MKPPKEIKDIVEKMAQIIDWTGNPSITYATALYFNQTMWELVTYGLLRADEIPEVVKQIAEIAEVPEDDKVRD